MKFKSKPCDSNANLVGNYGAPNRVNRLTTVGILVGPDIGWDNIGVLDSDTGIVYVGHVQEGGEFRENMVGEVEFFLGVRAGVRQ